MVKDLSSNVDTYPPGQGRPTSYYYGILRFTIEHYPELLESNPYATH